MSLLLRILALLVLSSPVLAAGTPEPVILVFGDSLSAGYGMAADQSWPALLARRLEDNRPRYRVSNASVSGETTAGGRTRLPAILDREKPAVVVLALGANDGLRGLPVAQMRDNLVAMVRAAKAAHARVLLAGMKMPPNYGPDYGRAFSATFNDIARNEGTALLPFLIEPIAEDRAAFQADGLHPDANAQPLIMAHVWKALAPLLRRQ